MLEIDTAINTLDLFISQTLKKYEGKLLPQTVESSLETLKLSLNNMLVARRKNEELQGHFELRTKSINYHTTQNALLKAQAGKTILVVASLEKQIMDLKKANNELLKGLPE